MYIDFLDVFSSRIENQENANKIIRWLRNPTIWNQDNININYKIWKTLLYIKYSIFKYFKNKSQIHF